MELSYFLAQIFALLYVVVGVGILVDTARYRMLYDEMLRSGPFMYMAGVASLLVGYFVVSLHNIWVSDWTVIITIVGWLALLKGMLLLVAPKVILRHTRYWMSRMQVAGTAALILGLVLGYYGFIA